MKIVFDNLDFSESLEVCFKSKHQIYWIAIVRVYRNNGEVYHVDMPWNTSHLIPKFLRSIVK